MERTAVRSAALGPRVPELDSVSSTSFAPRDGARSSRGNIVAEHEPAQATAVTGDSQSHRQEYRSRLPASFFEPWSAPLRCPRSTITIGMRAGGTSRASTIGVEATREAPSTSNRASPSPVSRTLPHELPEPEGSRPLPTTSWTHWRESCALTNRRSPATSTGVRMAAESASFGRRERRTVRPRPAARRGPGPVAAPRLRHYAPPQPAHVGRVP